MTLQLTPLSTADIREAAALHLRSFPSFFLSELGERFLREFYRGFLDDGAITAIARDEDGRLLGVVVGHMEPAGFFRRLLRRRWYAFGLASLSLVIRRPSVLPRIARAVTYRGQAGRTPQSGALLSSICVDPQEQGAGTGRKLLTSFTDELARRGGARAYLTTDAAANESANAFYLSAGWHHEEAFLTPEGRRMNCYVWLA